MQEDVKLSKIFIIHWIFGINSKETDMALCYDRVNKRLYKGAQGSSDSIFVEHDKKGYKTAKFSIPDKPVEVIVSSNLYYQGASYLYAKILFDNKLVLNFQDKQSLYLVNHNGIETFQVKAGNWDELFNIIIKTYENLYITSEIDIQRYFDELDYIISCNEIMVYRNKTAIKSSEWEGSFLVLLHAADRLKNIIQCKEQSVISNNNYFSDRLITSCKKYLQRFSECFLLWELKEEDSRVERLSKELLLICEYVERNGEPLEFAKLLIKQNV